MAKNQQVTLKTPFDWEEFFSEFHPDDLLCVVNSPRDLHKWVVEVVTRSDKTVSTLEIELPKAELGLQLAWRNAIHK